MVWGCFSGVVLGPLVPVKGSLKVSVYQDILDNVILLTLWEQFGDGPFLFQHDCVPVHNGLLIQHQCLTSQMRFWKNGQTFP